MANGSAVCSRNLVRLSVNLVYWSDDDDAGGGQTNDSLYVLFVWQRLVQSWGGGGEAGRPDRVPEAAQHLTEQEAAGAHCSALTTLLLKASNTQDRERSVYCSERRNQVDLYTQTESAPTPDRLITSRRRRWSHASQSRGDRVVIILLQASLTHVFFIFGSSDRNKAIRSAELIIYLAKKLQIIFLPVLSFILYLNKIFDFLILFHLIWTLNCRSTPVASYLVGLLS